MSIGSTDKARTASKGDGGNAAIVVRQNKDTDRRRGRVLCTKKDTINKGVEGSTDFLACQLILSSTDVNTVMPERKKKEKYGTNRRKKKKRERENTNPLIHQPI